MTALDFFLWALGALIAVAAVGAGTALLGAMLGNVEHTVHRIRSRWEDRWVLKYGAPMIRRYLNKPSDRDRENIERWLKELEK